MASKKLVIRGGLDLNSVLSSGGSDPVLTRNPTTKEVGETTPLLIGLPTTLLQGYIYIGDNTSTAQARLPIGDINLTDLGLVTINDGVITDSKVSPTAGIAYSKLNLSNSIVNADIATTAAIVRSKLASGTANRVVVTNSSGVMIDANSITPNRVLISDSNGIPTDSGLTTTVLGYVDPTSSIQTQLNNRLSFSSSITPNEGDIVAFQSGVWSSFPRGSSGQYLTSTVGGLAWTTTPNGLPVGGVGNEILRKIDATDYNTEWHTLVIADLTDITANATQVNELATGYYDATSSIQTQFSFKLNNALANNAMFVGNSSNQVSQLAPGSNGQVLTIVAGVPQWQTVSGTGTVTSVAFSGGTTGLSVTGSPITTSGTITLTGTLGTANGGTNITSYTTGDLPYASSSTVLSKLGIGTNGYVLTVSGGLPSWQPNVATTPLTTKGDIFVYSTTNDRLPVGVDGYHLTADSGQPTGLSWTAPVFNPFSDLNPILYNNADNTKLARLDVSSVTTGTTRVYTLPDFNGTIALLGSTNGAALSKADDTNVTLTLSAGSGTALLNATTITVGWTGTLADGRIASSANWNTAYNRSGTSLGFTSSTFTFTKQDTSTLTVLVPTFNQNTTGSAGSVVNSLTVDDSSIQLNSGTTYNGSAARTISVKALGITNSMIANATIDLTSKVTGDLPFANLAQGSAHSILGVTGNAIADVASIQSGAGYNILRANSGNTGVDFGSIDLSQSGAVGSSILGISNGGIGSATITYYTLASGGTATGTNTFTMGSNPFILSTGVTTGSGATAGFQLVANSLTTGNGFDASSSSITTGNLLKLTSTSTAGNSFSLSNINSSGANANSSRIATGETISVTNTGTSSTNIGLNVTASGGTNNYAILATGRVGIGNTTPVAILHVTGSGSVPTLQTTGVGTGTNYSIRSFQSDGTTEIFSLKDNGLTINTSTVNGSQFTSTWTATANNQSALEYLGTITTRNTNSDTLNYLVVDPTLARNAGNPTGITMTAFLLNPTFSNTATTTRYIMRMQNGGTDAFTFASNSVLVTPSWTIDPSSGSATVFGTTSTTSLNLQVNSSAKIVANVNTITFQNSGSGAVGGSWISFNQTIQSTGSQSGFTFTGGAHSGLTAATEITDVNWDLSQTKTWQTTAATTQRIFRIQAPTYNVSGGGTFTDVMLIHLSGATSGTTTTGTITNSHGIYIASRALTNVGTSYSLYVNAQTGATNNYAASFAGGLGVQLQDIDLVLATTTGTKIGTATSQKLGFWNTTPIIQPTTAITASTFVANTSLIANDSATWDGYTMGQIVKALRNIGLLA